MATRDQATDAGEQAGSKRVVPERCGNRHLTLAFERGWERTVAKDGAEVLSFRLLVLTATNGDDDVAGVETLTGRHVRRNLRRREDHVVNDDRQLAARIACRVDREHGRRLLELDGPFGGEGRLDHPALCVCEAPVNTALASTMSAPVRKAGPTW